MLTFLKHVVRNSYYHAMKELKEMILAAINNINITSLLDSSISLATVFGLGGIIGFERQVRQRTSGLRTNVLVAVRAVIFVDMANRLGG